MNIKEILIMHHSHLDIGYTHTQPVIEELQKDFIDQAFELLEKTEGWDDNSKPRWTCEVTWQFRQWLERSTPKEVQIFQKYIEQQRLAIGAMENNSTPLASAEELINSLSQLGKYRELTGAPIKVAFQHDVTGIPWTMTDLLLDSGVELLVMCINLHTSNDGPGDRPNIFRWVAPSGRELLVMNAHHYTSFDQVFKVNELSIGTMQDAFNSYANDVLKPRNYPHDFLFMSSTNVPVMYDNGQPNIITAELIKKWNSEERSPLIRYVTPEMLLERIKQIPLETLDKHRGDWTDFWNHGATSTAWETALNSKAKSKLKTTEMLGVLNKTNNKQKNLFQKTWEQVKLYDEHTWTSANSTYYNDECRMQTNIKCGRAIKAHELASYTLMNELEASTKNNVSFIDTEGMLVVNPTCKEIHQLCRIPKSWNVQKVWGRVFMHRQSIGDTAVANHVQEDDNHDYIEVIIPPFSWQKIPLTKAKPYEPSSKLKTGTFEQEVSIKALDNDAARLRSVGERYLESPFHQLCYNPKNGRIVSLKDKLTGWNVIPKNADFDFFELIHEEPDKRFDATRKSFYDRDATAEMEFMSCWNPDWRTTRSGITKLHSLEVLDEGSSICLKRCFGLKGMDKVEHKIRLFVDRPYIEVQIDFYRQANTEPEAVYCVTQLNLPEGWQAHFDTGGIPVELDKEQLDGCSHGWMTTNTFAAMHSGKNCAAIFNAEAPLIQIGDFNFGNVDNNIKRQKNPLMLAWPLDNYWETNFPLAQPGKISLRYGFQTFEAYNSTNIVRQADAFTNGLYIHLMESCAETSSGTLLEIDNPNIKVEYIKSGTNADTALLRLINLSDSKEKVNIKWNLFELSKVKLVTPQENSNEELARLTPNEFELNLEPRKITSVSLYPVRH